MTDPVWRVKDRSVKGEVTLAHFIHTCWWYSFSWGKQGVKGDRAGKKESNLEHMVFKVIIEHPNKYPNRVLTK